MQRIAIIGAGLSGTLLTINLLAHNQHLPLQVFLIEKENCLGRGTAYGTTDSTHLLNVPAGKMSLFPEEPAHFLEWLHRKRIPATAPDFMPRPLYGQYIRETLEEALQKYTSYTRVTVLHDEATDINTLPESVSVQLRSGRRLLCAKAVLALGNFPPASLSGVAAATTGDVRYVADPWARNRFCALQPEDTVLLIGTGLTMVDMVRSLHDRRHRGAIIGVSSHGDLPTVHTQSEEYPAYGHLLPTEANMATLLRIFKNQLRQAAKAGTDWRAVVDALRPDTAAWWQALPLAEKQRFKRHLEHRWNVARHRMPPESDEVMQGMLREGQLELIAGRVTGLESEPAHLKATVKLRNSSQLRHISASRVINCTGPQANPRYRPSLLAHNLLKKGLIRPDSTGTGIAGRPDGSIPIPDNNCPSAAKLFAIGPLLKAALYESVAVPEIRVQAQQLAKQLLGAFSEQLSGTPAAR